MPGSDSVDEPASLSAEVQVYIDAFAAEERPAPGQRATHWAAIERELAVERQRTAWLVATGVVLIAVAVVLLIVGVRGSTLLRVAEDPSVQVPWEGSARETGGDALRSRAGARASSPDQPRSAGMADGARQTGVAEEIDTSRRGTSPAVEPSGVGSALGRPGSGGSTASSAGAAARRRGPARARSDAPVSDPSPDRSSSPNSSKSAPSLAEELALFRRAKLAMVQGAAQQVLSLLDEHRERFPRGALRREGTVLRAEALCALGRAREARALRDRFVEQHAGSPLATRMQSVCR
ncbi:MAG: hypothetical protein AAGF11_20535 [Myxococcota bacterium]